MVFLEVEEVPVYRAELELLDFLGRQDREGQWASLD